MFSTDVKADEVDYGPEAETVGKIDIITEFTQYIYEKIHPRKAALIPENSSFLRMHCPFRLLFRQIRIPERHDAGDQINILLFSMRS